MFRIEFFDCHKISKIVVIKNNANEMFVILQIVFSIFEIKHYRIQFFVMRISIYFCFFEFIIEKRNKMSLIIFVFLIKHIIYFAIKCINFYAKFRFSIIMRKNKINREFNFEFVERKFDFLRHNKWKKIFFFFSIFRQTRKRYYDLREFLNKMFVKFNKI